MRFLPLLLLLVAPVLVSGQNKKAKKQYAAYITSADSAFDAKNYPFAKDKYKLASALKPKEAYPTERMGMCDKLIITQGVEYKLWVLKGDSAFALQDWVTAKTYYLRANSVKPYENYASDQAKNCNYQIVAKQAMEDLYKENLRRADSCYAARSWSCALANYQAAARIKPEQTFPAQRIEECNKKMATAVDKERYDITISDADKQYDAGNFVRAKQLYQEALTFNPGAKYATDRIAFCEQKINAPK